jgi:hypothetical protein
VRTFGPRSVLAHGVIRPGLSGVDLPRQPAPSHRPAHQLSPDLEHPATTDQSPPPPAGASAEAPDPYRLPPTPVEHSSPRGT